MTSATFPSPRLSHVALVDDDLQDRRARRQRVQLRVVPREAVLHLGVGHGLAQLADLPEQVDVHGDAVPVLAQLLQVVGQRARQTLPRGARRRQSCKVKRVRSDG